jgi:hypothetical protein
LAVVVVVGFVVVVEDGLAGGCVAAAKARQSGKVSLNVLEIQGTTPPPQHAKITGLLFLL